MRAENQGRVLAKCFNALHFILFSHFLQLIITDPLKVIDCLILLILSSRIYKYTVLFVEPLFGVIEGVSAGLFLIVMLVAVTVLFVCRQKVG